MVLAVIAIAIAACTKRQTGVGDTLTPGTDTTAVVTPEPPEEPDDPDSPDTPDTPDNPDGPDGPDTPDNPDNPDGPDGPDTPDNPDGPDTPEPETGHDGSIEDIADGGVGDYGGILNPGDGGIDDPAADPRPGVGRTQQGAVTVWTLNVKCQSDDGDLATARKWNSSRRGAVCAFFKTVKPLLVCTQECEHRQKEDILSNCTAYAAYGLGSDYGLDSGETGGTIFNRKYYDQDAANYIFYDKARLDVLASGTYWLSDTPDKVSKYSDSKHYRCCSWIKFEHKETHYVFYVFSTHLHQGYEDADDGVRSRQLDVLYARACSVNSSSLPMVICGDFNMTTTGSCLQTFYNKGYMKFARNVWNKEWDDAHKSYNAWGGSGRSNIDHIIYKGFESLQNFATDISAYNGVTYISDHYPVSATFGYSYEE